MPRFLRGEDYAKAFRAYYKNNPRSHGKAPARNAIEGEIKIGVRASNLHNPKNKAAVSREEEEVLKEYGVALAKDKDRRLKISSSVKFSRSAESIEADLKHAAGVRELYAPGGQQKGTRPNWTTSTGQRLNQLLLPSGKCTADHEEARALEQDAGLPLIKTENGRYRIDAEVLDGIQPRIYYFGEPAPVASSGPPLNASQDQQFPPQYPQCQAPDASQGRDQSYALQMFMQEWSQPYAVLEGGAENDVVYGSGVYGPGAVLPSVEDVSMAGVWGPQVDMSNPVAVGYPAFGSGPVLNPGFDGPAYMNPVATHAQSSRQALGPTPNWQAQQVQQPGPPQVHAPSGVPWFQAQLRPQSQGKGKGPAPS
ncbi:hypothetical protein [Streptomyces axinellae]|uniref:Uncharacterized protein n=1 Tax=Streptomyces axinellae TaxID=552788 RepID=A0ABN3QJ09_9ACTN